MNDEVIRLILDLVGQDNVEKLTKSLEHLKSQAKSTADTYEVLSSASGTYSLSERRVQEETDKLVAAAVEKTRQQKIMNMLVDEATTKNKTLVASTQNVTATTQAATTSNRDFGRGLLQTSYAIQDFTSQLGTRGLSGALGAIQNNIPVILTGLGVGSGLAGVASIATIAVGALSEKIEGLVTQWATGQTELETKRLEKMASAAEVAASKVEALRKQLPSGEAETAKLVDEYFVETGIGPIMKGLSEAIGASGTGAQATEEERSAMRPDLEDIARRAEMGASMRGLSPQETDRVVKSAVEGAKKTAAEVAARVQQRIDEENSRAAEKLVSDAPTSAVARRRIQALARQFPGAFPAGFSLEGMEPEDLAAADQEARDSEAFARRATEGVERRKKAAAERAKQAAERAKQVAKDQALGRAVGVAAARNADDEAERVYTEVTRSDIDERAMYELAALREQGGRYDRYRDRVIPMTEDQIYSRVFNLVRQELARTRPELTDDQISRVTGRITNEADASALKALSESANEAAQQGLDTNQAALDTAQTLASDNRRIKAALAAQEARFREITRQLRGQTPQMMLSRGSL